MYRLELGPPRIQIPRLGEKDRGCRGLWGRLSTQGGTYFHIPRSLTFCAYYFHVDVLPFLGLPGVCEAAIEVLSNPIFPSVPRLLYPRVGPRHLRPQSDWSAADPNSRIIIFGEEVQIAHSSGEILDNTTIVMSFETLGAAKTEGKILSRDTSPSRQPAQI